MPLTVDVVFACANESVVLPNGQPVRVMVGQHWPVDDPVVLARPNLFTSDSRFGMLYSQPRDEYDPTLFPPVYEIGEARLEREEPDDESGERDAPAAEEATAVPGEKRSVRRKAAA